MQKHHRNHKGSGRGYNANIHLPEPAISLILGLCDSGLGDGFRDQYLKSSYLSKYADPSPSSKQRRVDAAIDKWLETDARNFETTARLRDTDEGFNILPRVTWPKFVRFARQLVKSILGPLNDSIVIGTFSGGASTSRRRTESLPAYKYCGMADASSAAMPYVDLIHREAPLLRKYGTFLSLREKDAAVLFTVPKNDTIERCACKEPDLNMFLQKGAGRHIRRRLLRFGINLNDQGINRSLAHEASLFGNLCTLDLSSASDSISVGLVELLLPSDWFLYLNDIRSQAVEVRGETRVTGMFSSMGNGFTFELESLLFYVLVKSALYFTGTPGRVSIYGDDIICPTESSDYVVWVLSYFGFKINPEKSFTTGPFRESCGGHYHHGTDVTPFYLKRRPTHLTDAIRVANQLRRWLTANTTLGIAEPHTLELTWRALVKYIPSEFWGGYDLAVDTQLVSDHLPTRKLVRVRHDRNPPQAGLYLHWHNSRPTTEVLNEPHDAVDTVQKCRSRRVPPYQWGEAASRVLLTSELDRALS